MPPIPSHDLERVQALVAGGLYRITSSSFDGATALQFDECDIVDCIAALSASEFYKTMPSTRMPGVMQDVYRTKYLGRAVYVKLQERPQGVAVVISFKEL